MTSFVTKITAAAFALMLGAGSAYALSLAPGDNVSLDFQDDGVTISTFAGSIGAGPDILPYGGALRVDLNDGATGEDFSVSAANNYCGLICNGSVATMVFSGLDFSLAPGETFTIDNFTDTTGLGASFSVLSPSSFEVSWTDPVGGGANFRRNRVAFSGTFTFVPAPPAVAVPLSASAPFALIGIAGLLSLRSRRKLS